MPKSQIFVVEASAGSGKTYELARRYVQLCLSQAEGGHDLSGVIQSILCVTFTNKAAWEMKSRILDLLKRIALKQLKPSQVQDILKPLRLDEPQASQLGANIINEIIRQYHYFQVQTIDSFINVLLVGCSFKMGLSAHFKIQKNSKEYLQLALDDLLEEAQKDKKVRLLFEDFVRQYLFLENRLGWFPKEDLLAIIYELFKQYNIYQKPLVVYPTQEDLFVRKKRIQALMQELKSMLPVKTNKWFLDHLETLLKDKNQGMDVDTLKSYWAREEFPINKGAVVPKELESLWQKLRSEIHDLCWEEAHSLYNLHVLLFKELLQCFKQLSQRDDVLFLEEINRRASWLFEEQLVTLEELYFRLCTRFRHYLVDEFQDTSLSQWRNLAPLVQEALSCGGSLFYVGDKKQAIYAFRGGESRLFDALQSQWQGFNVQTKNLDKNYRSLPHIVAFNNRVFSLSNLQDFLDRRRREAEEHGRRDVIDFSPEDFGLIAGTFAHSQQLSVKSNPPGVVRVTFLQDTVKQQRMQEVHDLLIPLINELKGRYSLKDIAILTRGNEEVEEITQWLLAQGIWAKSERSSDIKKNSLIAEIVFLLQFLASPLDNNAFAQFCLGQIMPKAVGLTQQALQDFLFDCARKTAECKDISFYQCFREVYPDIWNSFFEDFTKQVGICPLYELTADIIERLGCIKNFPSSVGFFMHFLELIKEQEDNSCAVTYFLDYYENLEGEDRFVPMAQVNAIEILTVHKAKGLEFPVVIVPFLEMDVKASSGGRDAAGSYLLDIKEEGTGLIRLKESYRQLCPQLQVRYEQEYKKSFLNELNNAYVALTRASEELYVFVPAKVGNMVNPAKFLIPEDVLSLGTPVTCAIPAKEGIQGQEQTHWKIKPVILSPWAGQWQEESLEPEASAVWAKRGEQYHALLKNIDRLPLVETPFMASLEEIPQDLQHFINRPDVKRFFYLPQEAQVYCEKEFVNAFGDTRRIDRLIVLKDEVWVVDFKWSQAEEAKHQKQMQVYVELIKQLYPKHKISGHILYLA